MDFKSEVINRFEFLFKNHGFKIINNPINKEAVDYVVFVSGHDITLMFIHDRADYSLRISHSVNPDKWIELYELLGRLKQLGLIAGNFKASNKINGIKSCLKEHLKMIIDNGSVYFD